MNTSTAARYDVKLKNVGPFRVATLQGVVTDVERLGDTFDSLFGLLAEFVASNGRATGPYMALYQATGADPRMPGMHVELAIPFDGPATGDEQVRVYDLPGAEAMACVTYKGPFEEIGRAYDALFAWVRGNGYVAAGPLRDIYLSCGEGDSSDYITEVQIPVTR